MEIFENCNASGGGVALKIIEAAEVVNYNSFGFGIVDHVLSSPLVINAAAEWISVPILKAGVGFTETPLGTNGTAYEVSLTVFVPGNDVANIDAFHLLNGKRFLLDFTDNNDNRRLLGFNDMALKLSIAFNVPNSINNVSGHMLSFSGVVSSRAPKYSV